LSQIAIGANTDGRLELSALGAGGIAVHVSQVAANGKWEITGSWPSLGQPLAAQVKGGGPKITSSVTTP
jgi:hypothetical protein